MGACDISPQATQIPSLGSWLFFCYRIASKLRILALPTMRVVIGAIDSVPTIEDVRNFWDQHPLFTGETPFEPGSRAFFERHAEVYHLDCFAGALDPRLFPQGLSSKRTLDLGCGIGFWLVELARRGASSITGADLSANSLALAKQRCQHFNVDAELVEANAEKLPFPDNAFDHVNCQGVVHHTPSPQRAISEIHRVLRPEGTATISVYYRNVVLRSWPVWRRLLRLLPIGLKGRGRERMSTIDDRDEIVRLYDGAENPVGICYSTQEFLALLQPLHVNDIYFHFFPARALPLPIPRFVHRILDRRVPFMIYANVVKSVKDG